MSHPEETLARLKSELYRLIDHWNRLAANPRQSEAATKLIEHMAREVRKVVEWHSK